MASKLFLDANILLDFTLKRDSFPVVRQLMEKIIAREIHGYVSPAIIHITGYWLTKAYGASKARELLLSILADITALEIPHEVTLLALHSKISNIEDALQYYTALHHKLDAFISRDKALQKAAIPSLPVYTPDAFLLI